MPETTNADRAVAAALATDLTAALARLDREIGLHTALGELPPSQVAVLSDLDDSGPVTPGVLAGIERMRPASLTRHIAALEKAGLIKRHRVDGDKRQRRLDLTGKGRAALKAAVADAWLASRICGLSESEQADLRTAIPVLVTLYTTDDEIPADEDAGEYARDD